MAIIPGSNFHFKGQKFLDERQLLATSLDDLKNWNFDTNPIPEGFEVCINGDWYTYKSSITNSFSGHFFKRAGQSSGGSAAGVGLAIIDSNTLSQLLPDDIPEQYISTDIYRDSQIESSGYVQILFSAIRALLAEVTKLKNSFVYGVQSYKENNTIFSREVEENTDEPLWAIEEGSLEELTEVTPDLNENSTLFVAKDSDNSDFSFLGKGVVKFVTPTIWSPDNFGYSLKDYPDSKLICYLTTEKLESPSLIISLKDVDSNSTKTLEIPLSADKLNSQIIISRKVTDEDGENPRGYNYIHITTSNQSTDNNLLDTYISQSGLLDTPYYYNNRYYFDQFEFSGLLLSKFKLYSKYEDFSHSVIPFKPTESDYKYETAHITIRSVKNPTQLNAVVSELLTDELVWCRSEKKLYIIQNGLKIAIGASTSSSDSSTDNMTDNELFKLLAENNLIKWHTEDDLYKCDGLNTNFEDIVFINSDTDKKFKVTISPDGKFEIKEVNSLKSLSEKLIEKNVILSDMNPRGLIGKSNYEISKLANLALTESSDLKLKADRLKIGAFYAPRHKDPNNPVYGCSHAYIELENTSDTDIQLKGCYLHYIKQTEAYSATNTKPYTQYTLALDGVIKAGGTYLIRGKQYTDSSDANCFISVDSYDQEWYISKTSLIDFTVDSDYPLGFALVGNSTATDIAKTITGDTVLVSKIDDTDKQNEPYKSSSSNFPNKYHQCYIDSIYFGKDKESIYKGNGSVGKWALKATGIEYNAIAKNTFELDPAKLAFQGLTTSDSSRLRNDKLDNQDLFHLKLDNEFISFPHSDDIYPVSRFTPKASFENKNVSTDKTPISKNKPNMVTCSFGINMYTTRTFNWISCGSFDEYVWIKVGNEWKAFESYTESSEDKSSANKTGLYRKEFKKDVNNIIYARRHGIFPGANVKFTAHKCILNIVDSAVSTPTTYEYRVGRKTAAGKIDENYASEIYTFTLYPDTYTPRIYQTTDQQGFHWVEYQVWAAAAKVINNQIHNECDNQLIMPILLNTGDMTLNGTRINEWLDYYNGGKCLFNHMELVNVVGNNDLCGTNPEILGTGDDTGKSNSYYFHLFYCYEVNETYKLPIIKGKYVPSLYYLDSTSHRFILINSEITKTNCKDWFGLVNPANNKIVNAYTGFEITNENTQYLATTLGFTPIYDMVYEMMNDTSKQLLIACHEMPYTVITTDSISSGDSGKQKKVYRSLSTANKLIGSHTNLIDPVDSKGLHWLSRLMDYFNSGTTGRAKLMLGGHKHTFTCTYPVIEYYYYTENGVTKNSKDNGPMTMPKTLAEDSCNFILSDETNLTKFPIVKTVVPSLPGDSSFFYPATEKTTLTGGVTYFMCQATGYKLTSNKELPTQNLKFSMIIPGYATKTENGKTSLAAAVSLKFPMFARIDCGDNSYNIRLFALSNIMDSTAFNMTTFKTDNIITSVYNQTKGAALSTDPQDLNSTACWVPYENNKNICITIS